MKRIIVIIVLTVGTSGIFSCGDHQISPGSISAVEVREIIVRHDSGYAIIDVRTKAEYESETGHIPGARLIPLDEIEQRLPELLPLKDRELIIYCRSGRRSAEACQFLARKGFHVRNMEGGILKWNVIGVK
jgi:rhodanese-related sulfurtransferase